MKVSIIGTGYVGLITGVCLASKGHTVNCYDIDIDIVNSINNGIPPIYELKLEKMLKSFQIKDAEFITMKTYGKYFKNKVINKSKKDGYTNTG